MRFCVCFWVTGAYAATSEKNDSTMIWKDNGILYLADSCIKIDSALTDIRLQLIIISLFGIAYPLRINYNYTNKLKFVTKKIEQAEAVILMVGYKNVGVIIMSTTVKRGFSPNDEKEFGGSSVDILLKAGRDLQYLLNQGYHIKRASTFVGNHYLLSERQRLALVRAVSSEERIRMRKNKELTSFPPESAVHIDGLNTIITLEVALSDSVLLKCMDGTIRDLAALRGTYRLIDKTKTAIMLIGKILERNKADKVIFYLDAPVSNSGRLKLQIFELLSAFPFQLEVEVINNVDAVLEKLDSVITSDAIILDKCASWFNLNARIIEEINVDYPYIDFGALRMTGESFCLPAKEL